MEILEVSMNDMDILGCLWISMGIHEYPSMPLDIHGNQDAKDINVYPVISMDTHGHPRISMDINGSPSPRGIK